MKKPEMRVPYADVARSGRPEPRLRPDISGIGSAGRSIERDRDVRSIKAYLACLNARCTLDVFQARLARRLRVERLLRGEGPRHPAHSELSVTVRSRNDISMFLRYNSCVWGRLNGSASSIAS
jgi:hypothetical protein